MLSRLARLGRTGVKLARVYVAGFDVLMGWSSALTILWDHSLHISIRVIDDWCITT